MANVNVVKLKVRRGTDAQRKLITLDQGEIGYTIDSKRLFVGDGIMPGGISAGVKFYNATDITTDTTLATAITGDVVYDQSQTLYYILTGGSYNVRASYKPLAQITLTQTTNTLNFSGAPYVESGVTGGIRPISGSNTASGTYSNVVGGCCNIASGNYSFIGGGSLNTACGTNSNVAGGVCNIVFCGSSNVAGGSRNIACGNTSTVAGGCCNTTVDCFTNVAGGLCNNACSAGSNVAGGFVNRASGRTSNVAGGCNNTASGYFSNVAGGRFNVACGCASNVAGGAYNTASGT